MQDSLARQAPPDATAKGRILIPQAATLTLSAGHAAILSVDGEIITGTPDEMRTHIDGAPMIMCHAPYTRKRMGLAHVPAFDVLELFAFVYPARFCVPTPAGLARTLGLPAPTSIEDYPLTLLEVIQACLKDLMKEPRTGHKLDPVAVARAMGKEGAGWAWVEPVLAAFGETYDPSIPVITKTALNPWKYLPEWSETPPPPPAAHHPVTPEESKAKLRSITGMGGESRLTQEEYAEKLTPAFAAIERENTPHIVLAEAGTGVGKTLGYLSPAALWAEKNKGAVWISTYTRNLQRQIDQELNRLYPNPALKAEKIAIRKGRENYLCLLNLEDEVMGAALSRAPMQAVAAGLMARWAAETRDGDLSGGDFPGWLAGLLGYKHTHGLSDRRGECVYAACDHYHRCFVERAVRRAHHADIVVANHALVMIQTAIAQDEDILPQRYVFDEGHHLFDAADSAFSSHLSLREAADLRRWIRGAEGSGRNRARGLKKRLEDMLEGDADAENDLAILMREASHLPAPGWPKRLNDGEPFGAIEQFFALTHAQILARASGSDGPYSLETDTHPLNEDVKDAAEKLKAQLRAIQLPMRNLAVRLLKKRGEQAATLDQDMARRMESAASSLRRRSELSLAAWIDMLDALQRPSSENDFVDWMEIERIEGRAIDIGLHRHWIDPMQPFAASLRPHAHGVAITSATLRDATDDEGENWRTACTRTGASYLSEDPHKFGVKSPFDYADRTRIYIVNDVRKDDMNMLATAYHLLFEAAGGGGLGLFTAISRLRAVHERIHPDMEKSGLPLYAQHIDEMDTGTLVDIFREEQRACLLGTDAVRDGVDVPGDSLQLLIYDRVPWPRPTILHRARRDAFGGRRYDEWITRLKLRQAYGRLVRRADDRGVFVMMDSMLPTRMQSAFPGGVPIIKTGLADIVRDIRAFLGTGTQ